MGSSPASALPSRGWSHNRGEVLRSFNKLLQYISNRFSLLLFKLRWDHDDRRSLNISLLPHPAVVWRHELPSLPVTTSGHVNTGRCQHRVKTITLTKKRGCRVFCDHGDYERPRGPGWPRRGHGKAGDGPGQLRHRVCGQSYTIRGFIYLFNVDISRSGEMRPE